MPRYWALAVSPRNYRVLEAIHDLKEDLWLTGGSMLSVGDRVAIWQTLGASRGKRGIVCLGEVIGAPKEQTDSDNPYWLNREMASARRPRALVRYQTAPNLPLWVGGAADDLLLSLRVARAQGGTAFTIDESEWARLLEAAGGWLGDTVPGKIGEAPTPPLDAPGTQDRGARSPAVKPALIEGRSLPGIGSLRRRDLIDQVAGLVGRSVSSVIDARDGWPGLIQLQLPSGSLTLAAHVGEVGLSHRGRDDVERRFQNPGKGKPMSAPADSFPVLLGLWEGDRGPLLVGMEATVRMSRETRQSLFIPLSLLERAEVAGWAQQISGSGELLIAFHPSLLPVYVAARRAEVSLPTEEMADIAEAAGLMPTGDEAPEERARRLAWSLVRKRALARQVLEAYDGLCALCDLNLGLVEGAHIYPAEAPGSPDEIWNALALCCNHHAAFDQHRVWIEPRSLRIEVHPEIVTQAGRNLACRSFVETIRRELRQPRRAKLAPRAEMFTRRYDYFGDRYRWAS
jgi:HNH endonuclease